MAQHLECFSSDCSLESENCFACRNVSAASLDSWNAFIHHAMDKSSQDQQALQYYRSKLNQPTCCSFDSTFQCIAKLKLDSKHHYESSLECLAQFNAEHSHAACDKPNAFCCSSNHCNVGDEFLNPSPGFATIMIVLGFFLTTLVICTILCFLLRKRYRRPQTKWRNWFRKPKQNDRQSPHPPHSSTFTVPFTDAARLLPSETDESWVPLDHIQSKQNPQLKPNRNNYVTSPSCSSTGTDALTQSTMMANSSMAPSPDLNDMTCSGSGSGKPLLVLSTAARQVRLEEVVGEGRFGQVWRGTWKGDHVAAKIFSSRDECSWDRERTIYETFLLRHANVLGFIAADNRDTGLATELWLITDYHPLGSLFQFLHSFVLSPAALLRMATSLANGLAHLHNEIRGTRKKPRIAHRDLKSRNILVKLDGECCIGDMGFAVSYDSHADQLDIARNPERVGTRRYMAPEVLSGALDQRSFEAFLCADMYSFGLVMWELFCALHYPKQFQAQPYCMPYEAWVNSDPSVEEMCGVVVERQLRPDLPHADSQHPCVECMRKVIEECWYQDPMSRLNVMRVKKDFAGLRERMMKMDGFDWHFPADLIVDPKRELPSGFLPIDQINAYKTQTAG